MQLTDLEPSFVNDAQEGLTLVFLCPVCRKHKISVPVVVTNPGGEGKRWAITSIELASLTCTPSIAHIGHYYDDPDKPVETHHQCESHFHITNGKIIMA